MENFDITNIGVFVILIIGFFSLLVSIFYFLIPFWISAIKKYTKQQYIHILEIKSLNIEICKTLKNIEESLINIETNKD